MTGARGDMTPDCGSLGKKVDYPAPPEDEWVPTENKQIWRNVKTGQLRTDIPANEWASFPFLNHHPLA